MCHRGSWHSERIPLGTSVCSGDVMDADAYAYAYVDVDVDVNANDAAVAVVENDAHKPEAAELALAAVDGEFGAAAVGIVVEGSCWSRLQCWECKVTWAS